MWFFFSANVYKKPEIGFLILNVCIVTTGTQANTEYTYNCMNIRADYGYKTPKTNLNACNKKKSVSLRISIHLTQLNACMAHIAPRDVS